MELEMDLPRVTMRVMVTIAGCLSTPGVILAADDAPYQTPGYQTPGYAVPPPDAPATNTPGLAFPQPQADVPANDVLGLVNPKPQANAPANDVPPANPFAKPEVSFRDRLMQLNNVGPTVQMRPGFTTSDTTSSYSTSAGQGFTTQNTTPSFTTGPNPKP
jgi:hypothetical protein